LVRPRLACKNILPGIGECHVTARLVARGRISHKLTFDLVGKCSCESFESTVRICSDEAAVQCTGGSHQQHCRYLRAVTSPEPDVLVTHLAIRRAGDARRARLGMHGLADNGCARALFGSVTPQAASGCSASLQRGQVAP